MYVLAVVCYEPILVVHSFAEMAGTADCFFIQYAQMCIIPRFSLERSLIILYESYMKALLNVGSLAVYAWYVQDSRIVVNERVG